MRSRIVDEARKWIGVRWRHQGRDRTYGVDCVGLGLVVGWSLDLLPREDHTAYRHGTYGRSFQSRIERAGMILRPVEDMDLGDVLILEDGGYPCHLGIYTRRTIIHAHIRYRRVVEEAYSDEWKAKTLDCYSYPGSDP